ncbi:hypothetical protein PGB90_010487 [Kerria lacca]
MKREKSQNIGYYVTCASNNLLGTAIQIEEGVSDRYAWNTCVQGEITRKDRMH